METSSTEAVGETRANTPFGVLRKIFAGFLKLAVFFAVLFVPAGRLDWFHGWLFFGFILASTLVVLLMLRIKDPELLAMRRRKLKDEKNGSRTKTFDVVILWLMTPLYLAILIIGGLDSGRFGWSQMHLGFVAAGFALCLPAVALFLWSVLVNTHFESTVRIQSERDHKVCTSGPYRCVRHPGYVAIILSSLSMPLMLGSWWSLAPASLVAVLMVVRTALEDSTLRRQLRGYEDYALRVRYRLVPFIW